MRPAGSTALASTAAPASRSAVAPRTRSGSGVSSTVKRSSRQPVSSSAGRSTGGRRWTVRDRRRQGHGVAEAPVDRRSGRRGRDLQGDVVADQRLRQLDPAPSGLVGPWDGHVDGGVTVTSRRPVIGEKSPVGLGQRQGATGPVVGTVRRAPTAAENGVIQAVAGSRSATAQPAAEATPVNRVEATGPAMPSRSARSSSDGPLVEAHGHLRQGSGRSVGDVELADHRRLGIGTPAVGRSCAQAGEHVRDGCLR